MSAIALLVVCVSDVRAGTKAVTPTTTLNVRSSAWGPVLGTIAPGTGFVQTGREEQGFLEIYFRGARAWVSASYVRSYSGSGVQVTASTLNVRSAPSGSIVGQVHAGDAYVRVGSSGGWTRIQFDQESRWVATSYTTSVTFGGGTPGNWAGSKVPAWLRPALERACAREGFPASWATSPALAELIEHESSFNPKAQNPTSTAYGLFQFLNATWATVGGTKTSDPELQCVYGLRYVKQRYGSPEAAWAFWQKNRWY